MVRNISGAFMGGLLGALVDSLNIWWLGKAGVTAALGIGLAPNSPCPGSTRAWSGAVCGGCFCCCP
ncbi:hypothetical protein [Desulfuromonas sp. DDH964]|uniref:hypothetical protein n=1 Tax=Desulfuromonas sp. DDH964 TaxID=1823759 RepID=UPI001E47602D|nr:hypothetical protein [Desulfuromonas sp. DDH964]